jgi:curved DNA-binding protein CbpA
VNTERDTGAVQLDAGPSTINSESPSTSSDYFALLHEPRRPWLDPEKLKERFLALSAESHPDRVHQADSATRHAAQERYADLNSAYQCLRDPKERLAHLLELELGTKPSDLQQVPQDLLELFMEVSGLCRQVDAFLAESGQLTSPLLRVQGFQQSQEWVDKVAELLARVQARYDQMIEEVKSIDGQWGQTVGGSRRQSLGRLEEIYRLLSYFGRWRSQLEERSHRLVLSYV